MKKKPEPDSDLILYLTEDGRTRVQCRFENETLWLTQALAAEHEVQMDLNEPFPTALQMFKSKEGKRCLICS